ncbi:type-1 fimbrial protein subunit A [Caballeronia concitans]|uniref:Type-1 fimbrial protein subunit A n=2 Tax=Caballeronia concitans TaxID=1777133 RepID=A0A658QWM9_9BURK|nr:Fimbrial protein [Burkholderia sp. MR1]SAL28802.1 type-1 fimbrial protein subunit A [Caballeronia concitans]
MTHASTIASSCRTGRRLPGLFLLLMFAIAWACALPGNAYAGMTCGTGNVNKSLATGAIPVSVSAVPGMTVATVPPAAFQLNCHFISTLNPTTVTSAVLYADFKTNAPLVSGYNDVYQTSVAGLGVRFTFDSSQCSASGVVLANGAVRLSCPFSGPLDGPYMAANVTVTATLLMTGPLASGASSLTSAPAVTITFSQSDQSGSWGQTPLFTGAASGVVTHATCSVNQSSVAVLMPTADTRAFAAGIGAVAAPQPFSLSLSCSTGATVLITLTDAVDASNRTTTLKTTADSTAQGIGVQILNSAGTPVAFGPDSALPGNTNQWTVGSSPNGTLQVPLTARYVRTGAVNAGTVRALATFTMSYQ